MLYLNNIAGLGIIVYVLIDKVVKVVRTTNRPIHIRIQHPRSWIPLPYILAILVFLTLITLYTPIITQYDALSSYLQITRDLASGYNSPIHPSFVDRPPAVPILYSLVYLFGGLSAVRMVPLIFLGVLLVVIYKSAAVIEPKYATVRWVSVIAMCSMLVLYIYMSKWSLYVDLGFTLFLSILCYVLLLMYNGRKDNAVFSVFGMISALSIITKEFGVFYFWIFLWLLLVLFRKSVFGKVVERILWSSLLLSPFLIYHLLSSNIFLAKTVQANITELTLFRIILVILFFAVFIVLGLPKFIRNISRKNLLVVIVVLPLLISGGYLAHNYLTIGSPFGSYVSFYRAFLRSVGIEIPGSQIISQSNLGTYLMEAPNFFLSTMLCAPNIIPLLLGLLITFREKNDKYKVIVFWFLFSLLFFSFLNLNQLERGFVRYLMPLTVPSVLLIGIGVHSLLVISRIQLSNSSILYLIINTFSLFYIWFIKGNGSWWWLNNLQNITNQSPLATLSDLSFYTVLWIPLLLYAIIKHKWKTNFSMPKISFNGKWKKILIIPIFLSLLVPFHMLYVTIGYVDKASWNPDYHNQPESILDYSGDHFIEVIKYYQNNLNHDHATTLGMGVSPLDFMLNRPFIDLASDRNKIYFLDLLQEQDLEIVIQTLEKWNISYFLIPREDSGFRIREFTAISKNSTLFTLIIRSERLSIPQLGNYEFIKLASFKLFDLYILKKIPL
jgi:hypothetical protein